MNRKASHKAACADKKGTKRSAAIRFAAYINMEER